MLFTLFVQRGLTNWDKDDMSMYSASSHWMPQHPFFSYKGYQIVDFMGYYENLEDDWKHIAGKLEVNEKLPFVGASNTGKQSNESREKFQKIHYSLFYKCIHPKDICPRPCINKEVVKIVTEFYKKDLELMGYEQI
jgi:hypothetical protein